MNIERLIQKIYNRKYARITLHIVFWLLFSATQFYLNSISFSPYRSFPDYIDLWLLFAGTFSIILFYYPFVYFILPRFFYKKKLLVGIIFTILLIILYAFYDTLRENYILKDCVPCMASLKTVNNGYFQFLHMSMADRLVNKLASGGIIGLLFSLALPLSIKLGMQALRNQFRSIQLAKENLQLEFNFLKSQVNPHFLFNTLNNIYGLILNNHKEKSAGVVARLSQFLRYSLYESNAEEVPVGKEQQLLKDYIDLESIRLNHSKVGFVYETDDSVSTMPPMLLIPVIENAFKYCSDKPGGYIEISLQISHKTISFFSKNSIDTDRQLSADGGIGLSNLGKRLQLYYPGKHTCKIFSSEKEYSVLINIDCNE